MVTIEEIAREIFVKDDDNRIHTELLIFCGIALAVGLANFLIRGAKDILTQIISKVVTGLS